MERHHRTMLYVAFKATHNHADAEDVVQEAEITAFRSYHTLVGGEQAFGQWLRRIVVNKAIDLIRRRRADPAGDLLEVFTASKSVGGSDAVSHYDRDPIEDQEMWSAVRSLPELLQMVMLLKYEQDLDLETIAAEMNLTVQAVKSRLYRGRLMLRSILDVA